MADERKVEPGRSWVMYGYLGLGDHSEDHLIAYDLDDEGKPANHELVWPKPAEASKNASPAE